MHAADAAHAGGCSASRQMYHQHHGCSNPDQDFDAQRGSILFQAYTGLPLSRTQLKQQVESKDCALRIALARNEGLANMVICPSWPCCYFVK